MNEIRISTVDRYTSSIQIDDKKVFVRDRYKIQQDRQRRYNFGSSLQIASVIVGLLAAFYILGIAGHSDYVTEAHLEDVWFTLDYIVRFLGGTIVIYICYLVHKLGDLICRANSNKR